MNRKKCSVSGAEYDEGSFSDCIHRYIDASSLSDLETVQGELTSTHLKGILKWTEGILSEFMPHFKDRFRGIEAKSDQWSFEISKWAWMTFVLEGLKVYKWAEELNRGLYNIFCELQPEKGRIHKGDPLHHIGWLNLLKGTDEAIKKSKYYIKLAMIEDYLTDNTTYKNLAAFRVLRGEHNISDIYLDDLVRRINTYKRKHEGDPCFRPELIYLDYVTDPHRLERSSLYGLDSALARQLMLKVKEASTENEKGISLEILISYLFASTPGFEVLRNIESYDTQIDLIIRNLYKSDPILEELGKYIIVECRNIADKVDAKAIRDFAAKVIQLSCNSGILISKEGITGDTERQAARDARMAILKVQQRYGVVIIPLKLGQIDSIIDSGNSLLDVIVSEYEKIRFDII